MPGSPNKTILHTLIETLQNKVEPAKLYDAMKKIAADLNKVYETLFDGPLPAVSASNLNFDGLNFAYTDRQNEFTESPQIISSDFAELKLESGSGVNPSRWKGIADGEFIFSVGIDNNSGVWTTDGAGLGSAVYLSTAALRFYTYSSGAIVARLFIDVATGILSIGPLTSPTGAAANELIFENNKAIRGTNVAKTSALSMIKVNNVNLVEVASDAASSGAGHFAIPEATAANLPAASANQDGTIVLDTTNNRLCYYTNGTRRYILGTVF